MIVDSSWYWVCASSFAQMIKKGSILLLVWLTFDQQLYSMVKIVPSFYQMHFNDASSWNVEALFTVYLCACMGFQVFVLVPLMRESEILSPKS